MIRRGDATAGTRDILGGVTSRAFLLGLGPLTLALFACRVPASEVAPQPAPPPPAPQPSEPQPSETQPTAEARCRPELPASAAAPPGPAYVLVEHVGVVRIDDGAATTVWKLPPKVEAKDLEMVAGPGGELWLSGWDGVDVLAPTGAVRRVRKAGGGPMYEHMVVRAADDVWAVTSDIEWEVVHYDGSRWKPQIRRDRMAGKYDDNKFVALAVTSQGAWVSSWNGLWRGVAGKWREVAPPAGADPILDLWTYRDAVIASDHEGAWLREGDAWRPLGWPRPSDVRRVVGDVGLLVSREHGRPSVTLSAVTGEGCVATSEPLPGASVDEIAVDGAGRVWLATDTALVVVDGEGRKLAEWTVGSLPGFDGEVTRLVVVGAGPQRLPAARAGRTWEVVGKLTIYKSSAPLAGAAVELCSAPERDDRCPSGAFVRTATSAADGSFRFADVPAGDYSIVVRPPADNPDCDGIFRVHGHGLAPARDCPPEGGRCDLGALTDCRPFEMPPPP